MGEREARRIGETAGRAVDDLRDYDQRTDGTGTDARYGE
jgi:hypothetical protein